MLKEVFGFKGHDFTTPKPAHKLRLGTACFWNATLETQTFWTACNRLFSELLASP